MKCVLCGGGLQDKVVEEEVRVENNHYLVKMEVEVCQDCGERYYREGQIDELIQWKRKLKESGIQYQEVGKVYQVA